MNMKINMKVAERERERERKGKNCQQICVQLKREKNYHLNFIHRTLEKVFS